MTESEREFYLHASAPLRWVLLAAVALQMACRRGISDYRAHCDYLADERGQQLLAWGRRK